MGDNSDGTQGSAPPGTNVAAAPFVPPGSLLPLPSALGGGRKTDEGAAAATTAGAGWVPAAPKVDVEAPRTLLVMQMARLVNTSPLALSLSHSLTRPHPPIHFVRTLGDADGQVGEHITFVLSRFLARPHPPTTFVRGDANGQVHLTLSLARTHPHSPAVPIAHLVRPSCSADEVHTRSNACSH
jgi:hypothetical protein